MQNVLATWIYEDNKGEESNFPQSGLISSSEEHKAIYWRCVYMFFAFAKKYLKDSVQYCLFTNSSKESKIVDGIDIIQELKKWDVKIIIQEFTYKLPKGYYGSWGNQLYEFDILNAFLRNYTNSKLLMLDSDCIITKDLSPLFDMLNEYEAITFRGEYKNNRADNIINGITEPQMSELYYELTGEKKEVPYLCGEFFCANYSFVEKIMKEFPTVWQAMVNKYNKTKDTNTIKFNEEAHFLSYFYAKYNIPVGLADTWLKRMWTAQDYNTILPGDENYPIWHVLTGKHYYNELITMYNHNLLKKSQKVIIKKLDNLFLHHKDNFIISFKRYLKKIINKIKI